MLLEIINLIRQNNKLKVSLSIIALFFVVFGVFTVLNADYAMNPNKDTLNEDDRGGIDYALIYNGVEIYDLINDDATVNDLKYDLGKYAKSAYPGKFNENNLIGFTFKTGFKQKSENEYLFDGKYYGFRDNITISITKFDNGGVRLSIKNPKGYNIDSELILNGPLADLREKLPIEEERYSVRYLPFNGTAIITYNLFYQVSDVEESIRRLRSIVGDDFESEKIRYNVNGWGYFTPEEIIARQPELSQKP